MTKSLLLSLVAFYFAAVHAANTDNNDPLIVSLWHTWVNDAGTTIFWDSNAAPILEDSPEFLHSRLAAPTGAAYEIDVTSKTMSLRASDLSGVKFTEMPAGQADRYYVFIDATAQLTSATLASQAPTGVSVQIIPKGTELVAQDKSYPLDLDLQLDQDAVLIELGPGTDLQNETLEIVVNYVRVAAARDDAPTIAAQNAFTEQDASAAAITRFTTAATSLGIMALCVALVL
uniref:Uncharacterized protein n=1 Tax=Amphora coffeiformis TaxID=265554 RepID=A0A7S3LFW2_9STRA